jgi:uncharacterized protein (UPF0262 family)
MSEHDRISSITIDEASLAPATPDAEHERKIAIFDLLEENTFAMEGQAAGPYKVVLSMAEHRLVFDVATEDDAPVRRIMLSLTPFRSVIKDYFLICDSYYDAIRNASPSQIEAIDMGRRSLHNEGSELLMKRLAEKAQFDFNTARRLFTLVCALHVRM